MRRTHALRSAIAVITILAGITGSGLQASASTSSSLTGSVFEDANRNGIRDAGEAPFANRQIWVFGADGLWVAGGSTDADGTYTVSGLADGSYQVGLATADWWALRSTWVPTTTGSIYPRRNVSVAGPTVVDLGLRRIVRSTTAGQPLTTVTATNGLVVESYNDAVTAAELRDALLRGTLFGSEAPVTVVHFDLNSGSSATTSISGSPGSYSGFRGNVWVDYLSWLDSGDQVMVHEYGHVWSLYTDFVVQQDGTFARYLDARGLTGDSRLGTDKYWDPRELIAEDYRQLFGSPSARSYQQANRDIPPASQVPGLETFLSTTYMQGGAQPDPGPTPTPDPVPSITGLAMTPAPMTTAGTATMALSEDSTLTIRVVASTGSVVRTLLQSAHRTMGDVTAVWDRKTDTGRTAKAGTYRIVVDAIDGAGQAAQAAVTFSVIDGTKGRR